MHSMSIVTNDVLLSLNLGQMRTGNVYIYNPTGHHETVEKQLRQFIKESGLNAITLTPRSSEPSDNSTRQGDFFIDILNYYFKILLY